MLCRAARKSGNGSLLWPEGCESIEEVPVEVIQAVEHAFKILDWYENMTKDEVPPRWMWTVDHELDLWFEEVERQREEKYGGRSEDESAGMMSNELAEQLKRR